MSQYSTPGDTGSPSIPDLESLTSDIGTNPVFGDAAHNINVFGENGIVTRGDAATNTIFIGLEQVTVCGTGQTVNVGTADLVTIALGATPGTFQLRGLAAGKAATSNGAGFQLIGTFKTNGAAATVINTVDSISNKDLVLAGTSVTFIASGNDVIMRATGSLGS